MTRKPGVDAVCVNYEGMAWAAGLFDGEGCTSMYDTRAPGTPGRLVVQLSLTQIHRETVERFAEVVGVGRIYGPYFTRSGRHGQYTFKVSGFEKTQAVIAQLWPWLTPVKRAQASRALVGYRKLWRGRYRVTPEQVRARQREWARQNRARKRGEDVPSRG